MASTKRIYGTVIKKLKFKKNNENNFRHHCFYYCLENFDYRY